MEGQGTPDQSQAGPGEPPRDTTLRTSVHTQLADGEQGTPYNTYSPFRAWVDLEAGAAAAQSAGSARSATGAAASAAFSQGRLPGSHERLGAASAAPTNMAAPPEVMPPNQVRPRMEGGTDFGTFNMAGAPGAQQQQQPFVAAAVAEQTQTHTRALASGQESRAQQSGAALPVGASEGPRCGAAPRATPLGGWDSAAGAGHTPAFGVDCTTGLQGGATPQQATSLAQQPGMGQPTGGSFVGARLDFSGVASAQGACSNRTNLGSGGMRSVHFPAFTAGGAPSVAAGHGTHLAGSTTRGTPSQHSAVPGLSSPAAPFLGSATVQAQTLGGSAAPAVAAEAGGLSGAIPAAASESLLQMKLQR